MIRSQRNHRLDSNEFDQFLRPENMQATLYVGETEHGLYALPVYVFANTLAGPHKSIGPLLLDGPELSTVQGTTACPSGSENQHPDLSRPSIVRGENLQGVTYKTVQGEYILLGYHDYPTSIKGIIFDRGTGGGLMPTNPLTTAVTRVRHDLAIEQQMEWTQRKNSPPPPTTNSQSLNSSESILLTTETDLGAFLQAFYSNHPRSFIGFLVVFIGLVLTVVWMCGRQSAVSASVSSAHASVSRELSRPNHIIGNNAFEADSIPPLPSGWIQAGQMQFDPKAELGRGCEGTIVLKGRSNARDCAVKKIASHLVNIKREIDALLKCDSHENVVRFYDYCNDGSCCYIALELCDHTILDYVKMPKVRDSLKITRTEILRQAVAGMIHLHDRIKIVHRDIKPQNVLLSVKNDVVKVKISDFGLCKELAIRGEYSKGTGLVGTEGWIAPEVYEANEPLTHATDVFAMGCLFGFVLTGEHPFGDACFKQQANIREQKWSLQPLEKNNDYIAINLIESMIRRNPKRRPTINAVDSHPFFWNESKRLQMILDVSDCIEKMDENRYIMRRLERGAADIVTDNWGNEICTLLQTDLRSFRSYNSASVTHLIRALRNKKNHYAELPRDLQKSLGSIPRGYLAYFTSRFPKLLIHVYLAMASTLHAKESVFGLYEFQAAQVFLDDPSDIQYEHDDIAASEDDGFTPVINRNNAKDKKVGRMGKQRAPLKKTPLNSLGPSPRKS
ncbi:hypothetical protein L596_002610 [Steinernema carpocapsae]|uniref:non-specific serine/threonine protein kinase n=1 Tax=Steinernema carpocapsae TaxID=34508 RepID=A0A4U8UQ90_STECR|nr:hypothetical protein L596_002610 [Steinernema carpocapsae]